MYALNSSYSSELYDFKKPYSSECTTLDCLFQLCSRDHAPNHPTMRDTVHRTIHLFSDYTFLLFLIAPSPPPPPPLATHTPNFNMDLY